MNGDLENANHNTTSDGDAIHQVELTPMDNANFVGSSLPAPDEYAVDASQRNNNNGPPKRSRRRWMLYTAIAAMILLVFVVSISVGVSQGKKNKSSSTSESTSTQSGDTENGDTVGTNNQVSREDVITWLLDQEIATRSVVLKDGTPQQKAVKYLADVDPGLAELPSNEKDSYLLRAKYAMAVFFYSMGGESWDQPVGFVDSINSNVCAWNGFSLAISGPQLQSERGGIRCDDATGLPYQLDIEFNNLKGSMPTEIGLLTSLFLLDLEHNEITGELPTEICQLTDLGHLWLRENKLEGSIPSCMGNLSNLLTMNLQDNPFTGTLPSDVFCEMSSMQTIVLDRCNFEGTIPSCIGEAWANMNILSIADNMLTGEIPTELTNMASSVLEIYLDGNELVGNPLETIAALKEIDLLFIEENSFTGAISATTFGDLTNLRALDLSENQFTLEGTFPTEILALPQLHILDLSKNDLAGSFPDTIAEQDTIFFFSVHENSLTGDVPDSLTNLGGIQHIDFANNNMKGTIPESLFQQPQLLHVFLSENPDITEGPIPSFANATHMREISLKNTNRNGPLPDLAGFTNLFLFDVDDNDLTGTIPSSYGTLTALRHLILNSNPGLSGDLPEFTVTNNLGTVLLDKTGVTGDFSSICDLPTFTGDQIIPTDVIMIADCDDADSGITCDCCHCCTKDQPVCSDPLVASLDWTWEYGFARPVRDFAINATRLTRPTVDVTSQ